MTLVSLSDITKSYYLSNGVEVPVLKWIDLSIQAWEFVALMWQSGSWKSTLLNIIWFLHPSDGGEYYFGETNVTKYKDDKALSYIRNRKIWFIFQQYFLIPRLTAWENVMLPSVYANQKESVRKEKAAYYLEKVWLLDKLDNKPSELSGWQQQRVAIARALINEPDLILADEPTWALDSTTWKEVMELIMWLNEWWATIIMVTHEKEVAAVTQRVIYLSDGEVVDANYSL